MELELVGWPVITSRKGGHVGQARAQMAVPTLSGLDVIGCQLRLSILAELPE